jgi:hypothetical protein
MQDENQMLNNQYLEIKSNILAYPVDTKTKCIESKVKIGLVADHGTAHVVVGVLHALLIP